MFTSVHIFATKYNIQYACRDIYHCVHINPVVNVETVDDMYPSVHIYPVVTIEIFTRVYTFTKVK